MMEEVRGKMEEFYEGRCKREEGRNSNAHYNPYSTTHFQLLYLMFLDLSSCILLLISLLILRNRKMDEGRGKSFMREEGRSKMEDVTFRPTHRLSSCTLSPISSPTLHSPRKCFGIVYHQGNRCDVRGLSSTRILLLLSML